MHISKRAFTLIELLVVIAIIGVLSAVVLASLNTARSKGNDASVKSNLDNVRTQSEIYYDLNNSYTTNTSLAAQAISQASCATAATIFTDSSVIKMISAADKATGGAGGSTPTNITCAINTYASGAAWTIYGPMKNNTGSNTGWCIDSTGVEKADTAPVAYACP
jgi:prepilin-type N-terminal cleavage/methylation domain-containing protein